MATRKLGAVVILGLALCQPIDNHARAQEAATEDEGEVQAQPEPPDFSTIEDRLDSIATALEAMGDDPYAAANAERAQDDLEAQQDMATWTLVAAISACIGVAVSIGGLFALFISLGQTRRAIKDNRQIGEAQTRAYVSAKSMRIRVRDDFRIGVRMQLLNSGQSPARNVRRRAYAHLCVLGGEMPDRTETFAMLEKHKLKPVNDIPGSGTVLVRNVVQDTYLPSEWQHSGPDTRHVLMIFVQVCYETVVNPGVTENEYAVAITMFDGPAQAGELEPPDITALPYS